MNKVLVFFIVLIFLFGIAPLTAKARGAFLYLDPSEKSFIIGEEFSISIKVGTDFPINVVKTVLYFPRDKLAVTNISKDNSIFTLWPEEPNFSNEAGELSLVAGIPHPGFSGSNGQIISIKFKAKARGNVDNDFGESSILADDGKGTNIFSYSKGASYSIKALAPEIFSSTHSEEEKWYLNNNPEFHWEISSEITDVSFDLDKNSDTQPDIISEGKINSKTYENISDGIWYFHLRAKDNFGWSSTRHFAVYIDTFSPSPFEIIVNNEGDSTNPRPILYFDVQDETSGIDYYRIEFETGDSVILANPGINQYQMPLQVPGTHSIIVQAFDRAGNFRENSAGLVVKPIKKPIITVLPRSYVAGEEKLYIEGTSLPQTEVKIFLERDNNILREWQAPANDQGEWKFSTPDLLKAGVYQLFTIARDKREAISEPTSKQEIEVLFSGLAIGSFLLTFRNLALILVILLLGFIIVVIYFAQRNLKARKALKKETKEAEESLRRGFSELRGNIRNELEKLEGIKLERELNEKEKEIVKNLKEDLERVERFIGKEIKDVKEELK